MLESTRKAPTTTNPPPAISGFNHIKRSWDPTRKIFIARIMPGEVYVTRTHELISTLLGSCIAVCMLDKVNKIGGMNHFMLPAGANPKAAQENANYGLYAMELLINSIMKNGGQRQHLEAKVFGGGNVLKGVNSNVGGKNIEFVTTFLRQERIPILSQNTGASCAQQVYYHPLSGDAFAILQEQASAPQIKAAEKAYHDKINKEIEESSITFFD
ncbi:MAG: chemoreceptor glutamine deamidase CheD [Pseudomonadota bacterium]